jgi:hypothetical protein
MEDKRPTSPDPLPPAELHGKLVAWDKFHANIIAAGDCYQAVKKAALDAGESEPIFEQIPASDEGFVGSL